VSLRDRWIEQAAAWASWATSGHENDVLPQFFDLLPAPRGQALDVGCGEGRIARELRNRGYDVTGIDVAPRLIELARESDPDGEYAVAAAEDLPFADSSFGLVIAFNVLINVDDPQAAVRESARVLRRGGRLCASLVHPLASAGEWNDDSFVVGEYLTERPHEERVGNLVFANVHRPLEAWSRFFEHAGLLIEAIREIPRQGLRRWDRLPMFLYLRALKP
jgi:ubiquinone/menaquinone biosynthesis C-methylase UbiE